jgi:hypothetical protein
VGRTKWGGQCGEDNVNPLSRTRPIPGRDLGDRLQNRAAPVSRSCCPTIRKPQIRMQISQGSSFSTGTRVGRLATAPLLF